MTKRPDQFARNQGRVQRIEPAPNRFSRKRQSIARPSFASARSVSTISRPRPGVTEALHTLRSKGLIAYGRGKITVEDRKGMERTAEDAYGAPEAEYRRLIG